MDADCKDIYIGVSNGCVRRKEGCVKTKSQKLMTLDQAIQFINGQYEVEGGITIVTKKSLYNRIWEKKLKNYGTRKMALLDMNEILSFYGRKCA